VNILHVGNTVLAVTHEHGGATERRVRELAAEQVRRGHTVTVVSAGSRSSVSQYMGFTHRVVRCALPRPWRDLEFAFKVRLLMLGQAVDVVHVHSLLWGVPILRTARWKLAFQYDFFRPTLSDRWVFYRLYRWFMGMPDVLMAVSEYCANESALFYAMRRSRIHVLYNGVDEDAFCPDAERRERIRERLGLDGRRVVGYVGRFCEQKGSEVLLAAWERLRGTDDITLLVAGPGAHYGLDFDQDVADIIAGCGGIYLGAVPDSELADVYRAIDVQLMPTVRYEMFGMVAAEAMSCGTPLIASDEGGLPEVVQDPRFLCPVGRADCFAASALRVLALDVQEHAHLSAAVREAAGKFSWQTITTQALELYTDGRSRYAA